MAKRVVRAVLVVFVAAVATVAATAAEGGREVREVEKASVRKEEVRAAVRTSLERNEPLVLRGWGRGAPVDKELLEARAFEDALWRLCGEESIKVRVGEAVVKDGAAAVQESFRHDKAARRQTPKSPEPAHHAEAPDDVGGYRGETMLVREYLAGGRARAELYAAQVRLPCADSTPLIRELNKSITALIGTPPGDVDLQPLDETLTPTVYHAALAHACTGLPGSETASHTTSMHYDSAENFLYLASGHKRLTLLEPIQAASVAYLGANGAPSNVSPLDWSTPMFQFPEHALARLAIPWHVSLHAGDLLFIPVYWLHEVTTAPYSSESSSCRAASDSALSINFWFEASPAKKHALGKLMCGFRHRDAAMRCS